MAIAMVPFLVVTDQSRERHFSDDHYLSVAQSAGDTDTKITRLQLIAILSVILSIIILLAKTVVPEQASLGLIDIVIQRNAYGCQIDSFVAQGNILAASFHPELSQDRQAHNYFAAMIDNK